MNYGNRDKGVSRNLVPLVNAMAYCFITAAELRHRPYAKQVESPIRCINDPHNDYRTKKNV